MPQKTLRMNTCRIGSQNQGPIFLKIGRISEKEQVELDIQYLYMIIKLTILYGAALHREILEKNDVCLQMYNKKRLLKSRPY